MHRLEVIALRWGKITEERRVALRRCLAQSADEGGVRVRFLRSATVPTDYVLHLEHLGKGEDGSAKELGIRLAAALREYGPVCHTVWRAAEGSLL